MTIQKKKDNIRFGCCDQERRSGDGDRNGRRGRLSSRGGNKKYFKFTRIFKLKNNLKLLSQMKEEIRKKKKLMHSGCPKKLDMPQAVMCGQKQLLYHPRILLYMKTVQQFTSR
jgi:hypothetical protein